MEDLTENYENTCTRLLRLLSCEVICFWQFEDKPNELEKLSETLGKFENKSKSVWGLSNKTMRSCFMENPWSKISWDCPFKPAFRIGEFHFRTCISTQKMWKRRGRVMHVRISCSKKKKLLIFCAKHLCFFTPAIQF